MPLVKLSELLNHVTDNTYAIGSFNVSNMEMAMGAVQAAEELNAPLICKLRKLGLNIHHWRFWDR